MYKKFEKDQKVVCACGKTIKLAYNYNENGTIWFNNACKHCGCELALRINTSPDEEEEDEEEDE